MLNTKGRGGAVCPCCALHTLTAVRFHAVQAMYNDGPRVNWGGHILGSKSQAKLRKREKALAKEMSGRP